MPFITLIPRTRVRILFPVYFQHPVESTRKTTLKMLRFILLLIPLVNAWTFRYTNEGNETEIIRGSEERNCTVADIFEDKLFTWDPEGTKQCLSLIHI